MKHTLAKFYTLLLIPVFLLTTTSLGEKIGFDDDEANKAPKDWRSGITGKGTPIWRVLKDSTSPSKPHVLFQSGEGSFPWCVLP